MSLDTKSLIHQDLSKKYNKSTITKQEYANEIGVSISTVDSYIARGEGVPKYFKLGNSKKSKVLFNIVDVADFLTRGESSTIATLDSDRDNNTTQATHTKKLKVNNVDGGEI